MCSSDLAHKGLTELRIVNTMHERKAMMADLSDAFLALPGGLGTFEELFEVWTWSQLGIHRKPLGMLNVAGYYDPLVALVEHGVGEGFLRQQHRDSLIVDGRRPPSDRVARIHTGIHSKVDRTRRTLAYFSSGSFR